MQSAVAACFIGRLATTGLATCVLRQRQANYALPFLAGEALLSEAVGGPVICVKLRPSWLRND